MQTTVQLIIKQLSTKYDLPLYVIEEIVYSQFNFVREKIKEDPKTVIMLPSWGKYFTSDNKKELYDKREAKKNKTSTDNPL